jgi:hypothetical protein
MCIKQKKKEKGSLTIEAIISFTVFIAVSFLMLHLVKLTMLSLALQNATSETAKQIATASYPMVVVNTLQSQTETKIHKISEETGETLTSLLEEYEVDDTLAMLTGAAESGTGDGSSMTANMITSIMNKGENFISSLFASLKGKAGVQIAAKIMDGYLEASNIPFDKNRVKIRIVKLPETDAEFNAVGDYSIKGKKDDLILKAASLPDAKDNDFNKDDIVICAEYDYKIALPMIPAIELTLRSVSIEHAWLEGCQVRTNRKEGLDELFDDKVYIAGGGSGKNYHRKDCRMMTLNGMGYTPYGINRDVAISQKYTPCQTCNP